MLGRFANLFKGSKDPNEMTMDELFARDQRMYGDSVPEGSFNITGQGANRDPNRHSASNTN